MWTQGLDKGLCSSVPALNIKGIKPEILETSGQSKYECQYVAAEITCQLWIRISEASRQTSMKPAGDHQDEL